MGEIWKIIASIFWLIVRWFKRKDDPRIQYDKAKEENARIIASGDADSLNRKLDADCDRLPDNANTGDYPARLAGD
jgi:hypothetical protein